MRVQVRYFAAARAAVGQAEQAVELPDGATLATLVETVPVADADGRRVLARCSVIRNGSGGVDLAEPLADGDRIDLLPPFAGG